MSRQDWPVHQPECFDAPIPGRQWYAGCEPGGDYDPETRTYTGTGPRVDPVSGRCAGCGEFACPECGKQGCPDHEVTCDDGECGHPDCRSCEAKARMEHLAESRFEEDRMERKQAVERFVSDLERGAA